MRRNEIAVEHDLVVDGLCKSRKREACGECGIYMRRLGYGTIEEGTGSQVGQATQETLSKMARKCPVLLDRFGSID